MAWGFTNSFGDFTDLVRLVPTARAGWIATADGDVALDTLVETIQVAGGDAVAFRVLESPFGPVLFTDTARSTRRSGRHTVPSRSTSPRRPVGRPLARRRARHRAPRGYARPELRCRRQNGNIGWTIAGRIPRRKGRDWQLPLDSTKPDAGWAGWLAPDEDPRS